MKLLILMTVAMCLAASTLGGCVFCNDVGNLEDEKDGLGICDEYIPETMNEHDWGKDCCRAVCRREYIGTGDYSSTWEYNAQLGYYTCECCQDCVALFCG